MPLLRGHWHHSVRPTTPPPGLYPAQPRSRTAKGPPPQATLPAIASHRVARRTSHCTAPRTSHLAPRRRGRPLASGIYDASIHHAESMQMPCRYRADTVHIPRIYRARCGRCLGSSQLASRDASGAVRPAPAPYLNSATTPPAPGPLPRPPAPRPPCPTLLPPAPPPNAPPTDTPPPLPPGQLSYAGCQYCESSGTVVCINCQGSGLNVPDDFVQASPT